MCHCHTCPARHEEHWPPLSAEIILGKGFGRRDSAELAATGTSRRKLVIVVMESDSRALLTHLSALSHLETDESTAASRPRRTNI